MVLESSKMFLNVDNFYSPLSKHGYLTPLQRKKLREKRKIDTCADVEAISLSQNKVKRIRKSADFKNKIINKLELRKKKRIKDRIRSVENVPHVDFIASNLFPKKSDDGKEKKFFKCRSPKHLEKAKFTMPLVLKRNLLCELNNALKDKRIKASRSSKNTSNLDSCTDCELLEDTAIAKLDSTESCLTSDIEGTTYFPVIVKLNVNNSINDDDISTVTFHSDSSNLDCNISDELIGSQVRTKKSIFEFDWPSDESLKERERKARLAHRKSLNISLNTEDEETNSSTLKLFPVFRSPHVQKKEMLDKKSTPKVPSKPTPDTSGGGEQMIIDAGQKEIGAKECPVCAMIYAIGSSQDESLHLKYHHKYIAHLKFSGWKKENIIGEYGDGRVLKVTKDDKSFMLKKIEEILEIAHKDLGFATAGIPARSDIVFILFISTRKQVAGCLVAEPIKSACPVVLDESGTNAELDPPSNTGKVWKMGSWYSSSKTTPALCGINSIWVAKDFRRQAIASRMIDCLRCNFIYGHVVELKELAFTDPTPDGRDFAASYTKTDNFLVYK